MDAWKVNRTFVLLLLMFSFPTSPSSYQSSWTTAIIYYGCHNSWLSCTPMILARQNTLPLLLKPYPRLIQILLSIPRRIDATLTEAVLSTVFGTTTSRKVWSLLAMKFASRSEPHATHLKRSLQTTRQDYKSCTKYLRTTKSRERHRDHWWLSSRITKPWTATSLHQSHTPPPYLMNIILSCLTFSVEETQVWCPHQVAFPQNTLRREPFACF